MSSKKRNITTLLFASLIAAMILPFSSMDIANAEEKKKPYKAVDVHTAIKKITPYVKLNDNDIAELKIPIHKIPLDKKTKQIAIDYIEIQNAINNKQKLSTHQSTEKFSYFFNEIQENKTNKQSSYAWGDVCGGSPWNPHHVPPKETIYKRGGAENYLKSDGFHKVPFYASLSYGDDYAKEVDHKECNSGEMRHQGVINTYYTYKSQTPEPNPEIFSYTAPTWWWDPYVIGWHGLF